MKRRTVMILASALLAGSSLATDAQARGGGGGGHMGGGGGHMGGGFGEHMDGLASWQQKRVAAYIEERVADDIPLATLAELARLSPYHFCRSFKHSFGMPPRRYHASRRIERTKQLLAIENCPSPGLHWMSASTTRARSLQHFTG